MITRRLQSILQERLSQVAAVALVGPQQAGKTTLAAWAGLREASALS